MADPSSKTEKSYVADNAEVARGFQNAPIAAAILAANIGVFLAQVYLAGLRSAVGMPDSVLRFLGANASLWTIADNRFETLVTSLFIHGSIIHIAVNMFMLWMVGPLLERAVGSARFITLYLGAGIIASATSAIWGRFFGTTMSMGASGALCGVIAATLVVGVRTEGWRSELTIAMARWLGVLLVIGLLRAASPNLAQLDNAAHIGGALGGVMVAVTWERGVQYTSRRQGLIVLGCVAAVLLSAGVVWVRNHTDPYVFLDVEGRLKAALSAHRAGHCDQAREAMRRARQMDPANGHVRAIAEEIDRECSDPTTDRPTPRVRP